MLVHLLLQLNLKVRGSRLLIVVGMGILGGEVAVAPQGIAIQEVHTTILGGITTTRDNLPPIMGLGKAVNKMKGMNYWTKRSSRH